MDLTAYIRDIPDFPKPGILFKDITPLLADPAAFGYAIDQLKAHYASTPIDAIAAAEARGVLSPRRWRWRCTSRWCRCGSRELPHRTYSLKYDLEYGQAELHMHIDGIEPGARVLMIDDLLATGGTMAAGCQLIEQAGGTVVSSRSWSS